MTARVTKKVAPDGGWAWMVCLGVSLVNFSTRSLEPSFGLLFGDLLKKLGVETTGASFITSTLDSVVNFSGFFVGPIIKTFSYRKVCIVGSTITALGLLFTAPANSMGHILATYSILGGFGVGLASSSSFVSLNHFFSKKRGQAVGLSMAGTGFGLMVMPQLVRILLDAYGFRGAVLVLGGLAFHAVLGSCLLQPIKWHLKEVPVDEEMQIVKEMERIEEHENEDGESEDKFELNPLVNPPMTKLTTNKSHSNMNHPSVRTMGMPRAVTCDKPLPELERLGAKRPGALTTAASVAAMQRVTSSGSMADAVRKRKVSVISNISNMDFTGSYLQLYLDAADDDQAIQMKQIKEQDPQKTRWSFLHKFVDLMDLDLLRDWSFLNLLLGLSLFWSGELQFRMLTPFFISSLGYNKQDTAFCLSMTAISDVLVRMILPPIFDKKNISKKLIFFVSAFFLAATRSILAEQRDWIPLMVWLAICGFFRGICLSNFTLTISEYCPLEKLPAAFGLHMVGKGVFVVIIGPIIGYVRDYTGSYAVCIHVQNALIMSCVIVWGIEYAYAYTQRRKIVQI